METIESSVIQLVQSKYNRFVRGWVKLFRLIWRFLPKDFTSFLSKSKGDYVYVTICRENDFDMVTASLYSLYCCADQVPSSIYLISDGSWEREVGNAYFEKYHLPVQCLSWETCARFYAESCPALNEWAGKHIWGKKMAAILFISENNPTIFCDPDVLWHKCPLNSIREAGLPFKISIDNTLSYDQECLKELKMQYLNEREYPVNCGIVYIKGGLSLLNDDARRIINYQAEHCGPFAEQTVFAAMDAQYDSRWTTKEIRSDLTEGVHPLSGLTKRTQQLIARHYLWFMKPLYWRDLFRIYLNR